MEIVLEITILAGLNILLLGFIHLDPVKFLKRITFPLTGVEAHDYKDGIKSSMIVLIVRHKSATMMQRYAHHNVESLRDGVEALDRRAKKCDKSVTNGGFGKS